MTETSASYPAEYMRQLAGDKQKQWDKISHEGKQALQQNGLGLGDFGDLNMFKSFGERYMAARELYLGALGAAKNDIDAIAEGIKQSAQTMTDHDVEAGAAFLALQRRWENGGMQSEANQTTDNGQHQQRRTTEADAKSNAADARAQEAGGQGLPATTQGGTGTTA